MKTWIDIASHLFLGIGTWAWGDKRVWGYGKDYSDSDLKETFDACIAAGINFFDTAEMYGWGKSEELIGRFIRESGATAIIATKFMPLPWRLRQRDLLAALERSLKRLGLKTVHLYQIHFPLHLRSLETWMDVLAEAVNRGLTLSVGVSNYSESQMRRAHERLATHGIPLMSNQVEFNMLNRNPERNGVMAACNELGIKLIAYSPLAMGVLTGKYSPGQKLHGYRGLRYNRFLSQISRLTGLMKEIGESHGGKSPSQVALNWTIVKGAFPIPGAKNAKQAAEHAGALGWSLSSDEIQKMESSANAVRGKRISP